MTQAEISVSEYADRIAIRELVDEYARCADRRLFKKQQSLFIPDARFVIYMQGEGSEPTQVIHGRAGLEPYFAVVDNYEVTQHFIGQSTVVLSGDTAAGETYCIASHVYTEGGERKLMTVHLRYVDRFTQVNDAWLFAERNLYVDWIEPLHQSPEIIRHLPEGDPTKRAAF